MKLQNEIQPTGIRSFHGFCLGTDITPITGWRMRKRGWIETINISGRPYVTDEEIARFKRRAAAGEFAKKHKVPAPQRVAA